MTRLERVTAGSLALIASLAAPALGATLQDTVGSYSGSWTNDTFQTTGSATASIAIHGSQFTITFDLGGMVFGLLDPAPIQLVGTIDQQDVASVSSDTGTLFGAFAATIRGSDGTFNLTLSMLPQEIPILTATASGTVNHSGGVQANYQVHFADMMHIATGRLTADPAPEPAEPPAALAVMVALGIVRARRPAQARARRLLD